MWVFFSASSKKVWFCSPCYQYKAKIIRKFFKIMLVYVNNSCIFTPSKQTNK